MKVFLRELEVNDAEIAWEWRNDPEVWKLTGRKWNNHVTQKIEEDWIKKVKEEKDSVRFAICVGDEKEYVGNVQLTNIEKGSGIFHIFIGNKNYWGKGIGEKATKLLIDYTKANLELKAIKLLVRINNKAAIKIYEKVGFCVENIDNENFSMIYKI